MESKFPFKKWRSIDKTLWNKRILKNEWKQNFEYLKDHLECWKEKYLGVTFAA